MAAVTETGHKTFYDGMTGKKNLSGGKMALLINEEWCISGNFTDLASFYGSNY